jgi:hypothetical protein
VINSLGIVLKMMFLLSTVMMRLLSVFAITFAPSFDKSVAFMVLKLFALSSTLTEIFLPMWASSSLLFVSLSYLYLL